MLGKKFGIFLSKIFPPTFLQEFVVKFAKSSAAGSLNSQQCIKSRGRKFPRNEACFVQKFASNLFHDTRRENRILLSTQDLARKISPNICKTRNFRNTHFLCLEQHKGRKIASLKERRAKSESVQFLPFFAAELRSQGISFFSPFSGLFSATAWLLPRVWMSVCLSVLCCVNGRYAFKQKIARYIFPKLSRFLLALKATYTLK